MREVAHADHQAVGTESPSVVFRPAPEIRKEESAFEKALETFVKKHGGRIKKKKKTG